MTASTPDAVAQARESVYVSIAMYANAKPEHSAAAAAKVREKLEAYGAAVRAECAAKVLESVAHENIVADLPARGARPDAVEYVADVLLCVRKRIRKTLAEAQP